MEARLNSTQTDRDRFDTELPYFVNGTLDGERLAWMQAWLVEHPERRTDVELERLMRETVRQAVSDVPEAERWRQLRARLTDEGVLPPAAVQAQRQPPEFQRPRPIRTGWAATWWRPLAVPWPAVGLALAALVVQGYWLTARAPDPDAGLQAARYRSATGEAASCASVVWWRVSVSPAMPVSDWAVALRTLGLTVVDGPADGGDWTVRVPPGRDAEQARAALRAVSGVEDVRSTPAPAIAGCP